MVETLDYALFVFHFLRLGTFPCNKLDRINLQTDFPGSLITEYLCPPIIHSFIRSPIHSLLPPIHCFLPGLLGLSHFVHSTDKPGMQSVHNQSQVTSWQAALSFLPLQPHWPLSLWKAAPFPLQPHASLSVTSSKGACWYIPTVG